MLKRTIESTEEVLEEVDRRVERVDQYQKRVQETLQKYKKIHEGIEEHLTKIKELEHLVEYFLVLQDIQDISVELTNCIHSKDEQKIVNLFLSLSGSPESTDSIVGRLQDVDAPHMKLYARRMALYWHDIIKEKLSW